MRQRTLIAILLLALASPTFSQEKGAKCIHSYQTGDSPDNPASCKKNGRDHGRWEFRSIHYVLVGSFVDGKKHGRWELRFKDDCEFYLYDHGEETSVGKCENFLARDKFKPTNKKTSTDPLGLGEKTVQGMVGKKIPYEYWDVLGSPDTLTGTNNSRWVAYLPKANISFISNKSTDIITFATFGKGAEAQAKKVPAWIKKQFSIMNGSHIKLTRYIKEQLHNPDSYKHVKTVYTLHGDGLFVTTTFRATNAFNATVTNRMKAIADQKGEIIQANLVE